MHTFGSDVDVCDRDPSFLGALLDGFARLFLVVVTLSGIDVTDPCLDCEYAAVKGRLSRVARALFRVESESEWSGTVEARGRRRTLPHARAGTLRPSERVKVGTDMLATVYAGEKNEQHLTSGGAVDVSRTPIRLGLEIRTSAWQVSRYPIDPS